MYTYIDYTYIISLCIYVYIMNNNNNINNDNDDRRACAQQSTYKCSIDIRHCLHLIFDV